MWVELLVTDFVTLICICCLVFFCITLFVVVAELLDRGKIVRNKRAVTQQVVVGFMLVHQQSLLVDGRVVVVVVGQRRDHQHLSLSTWLRTCVFSSTLLPWCRRRCS